MWLRDSDLNFVILLKMDLDKPISIFKEIIQADSMIRVITHLDTDGLMSASIMCKTLQRLNQKFWLTTVKQLETEFLEQMIKESKSQKWKAIFFLDLGSGNLKQIERLSENSKVFVLDHHELEKDFDKEKLNKANLFLVNPMISENERVSGAGVTYLFSKQLNDSNKDLSQFAVLGIIGDLMEKERDKTSNSIFEDANNMACK